MASHTRTWPWLIGLIAMIGLTFLCVRLWERDLETDAAAALGAAGFGDLEAGVEVSGQTVTLSGTVDGEAAATAAVEAVAAVEFVDTVDSQLVVPAPAVTTTTVAPTTQATTTTQASTTTSAATVPPALRGTVESGQIVIEGLVPSRAIADEIVAAATAVYGDGNVTDLIAVQDDVIESAWLADGAVIPLLGAQPDGGFDIANETVTLLGEVPDQATFDALEARAGELGLPVDNQMTVAPSLQERLDALALDGISFESGSGVLTAESEIVLDDIAALLVANPSTSVQIRGYTDSDGSAAANLALSQERAEAVAAYLTAAGVNGDRLNPVGFGEEEPIADNSTPEGKEANRRIEFEIIGGL